MKTTTSDLAKEIQPLIKKFILDNANHASGLGEPEKDGGPISMSQTIAYGICKALTSQVFLDLFGSGCKAPVPVPPSTVTAGNPTLGMTIFSAWRVKASES